MQTATQNIDKVKGGTKDQVLQSIMSEAERLTTSPISYFAGQRRWNPENKLPNHIQP